jgi:hypothetical protein
MNVPRSVLLSAAWLIKHGVCGRSLTVVGVLASYWGNWYPSLFSLLLTWGGATRVLGGRWGEVVAARAGFINRSHGYPDTSLWSTVSG